MLSRVLWPVFVPLAMLLAELGRRRRKALSVFLAVGLGVGRYLLYLIVLIPGMSDVHNRSIFLGLAALLHRRRAGGSPC
jgi:hypothetical protein